MADGYRLIKRPRPYPYPLDLQDLGLGQHTKDRYVRLDPKDISNMANDIFRGDPYQTTLGEFGIEVEEVENRERQRNRDPHRDRIAKIIKEISSKVDLDSLIPPKIPKDPYGGPNSYIKF